MRESPSLDLEDPSHPFLPEARRTIAETRTALEAVFEAAGTQPTRKLTIGDILEGILSGHAYYLAEKYDIAYDEYQSVEHLGGIRVLPRRLFLELGGGLERMRYVHTAAKAYARAGAEDRNYANLQRALAMQDRGVIVGLADAIAETTPQLLTHEEWLHVAHIAASTGGILCLEDIAAIVGPEAIREDLRMCGHVLVGVSRAHPLTVLNALKAYRLANAPDDIVAMAHSLTPLYAAGPVTDNIRYALDQLLNSALRVYRSNPDRYENDLREIASSVLVGLSPLVDGEIHQMDWSASILRALTDTRRRIQVGSIW